MITTPCRAKVTEGVSWLDRTRRPTAADDETLPLVVRLSTRSLEFDSWSPLPTLGGMVVSEKHHASSFFWMSMVLFVSQESISLGCVHFVDANYVMRSPTDQESKTGKLTL